MLYRGVTPLCRLLRHALGDSPEPGAPRRCDGGEDDTSDHFGVAVPYIVIIVRPPAAQAAYAGANEDEVRGRVHPASWPEWSCLTTPLLSDVSSARTPLMCRA